MISIRVFAVKVARCHTLCEEELVQKTHRPIGDGVSNWHQVVEILLRSVVASDRITIDKIGKCLGDRKCHVWNFHHLNDVRQREREFGGFIRHTVGNLA